MSALIVQIAFVSWILLFIINIGIYFHYEASINLNNQGFTENISILTKECKNLHLKDSCLMQKLKFIARYFDIFHNFKLDKSQIESIPKINKENQKLFKDIFVNKSVVFNHNLPQIKLSLLSLSKEIKNQLLSIVIKKQSIFDYLAMVNFIFNISVPIALITLTSPKSQQTAINALVLSILTIVNLIHALVYIAILLVERKHLNKQISKIRSLFEANYFALPEIDSLLTSLKKAQDLIDKADNENYQFDQKFVMQLHQIELILYQIINVDNIRLMNAKTNQLDTDSLIDELNVKLSDLKTRQIFINLINELSDPNLITQLYINKGHSAYSDNIAKYVDKKMNYDLNQLIEFLNSFLNTVLNSTALIKRQIVLGLGNNQNVLAYYQQFNLAGDMLTDSK